MRDPFVCRSPTAIRIETTMQILVAEDNVLAARQMVDLLPAWGYEPVLVHDGLAALQRLRGVDAPRLALLDWMMPGLDGIEVCRAVRQDEGRPYTYVILLTGQGGRDAMLAGLEAGADDFLLKPVDSCELKARLNTGRRIIRLQKQLLDAQRQLQVQATRDALTGLWNRAAILDILLREVPRAEREGRAVGVILADLDHFKHINDAHGHLAGDEALREVARRMTTVLRSYDTTGRYGGEEFLIVLPGCNAEASLRLAERVREHVAAQPVELDHARVELTISLGVAVREGAAVAAPALLREADVALYRAKAAGRNQAVLANLDSALAAAAI
jgi:two-component system cell cycle response regulator